MAVLSKRSWSDQILFIMNNWGMDGIDIVLIGNGR